MTKLPRRTKALESTAYHEAGHAVMAWHVGVKTKRISIVPSSGSAGIHEHKPYLSAEVAYDSSPRMQRRIENMVLVCCAGPWAQRRFNPKGFRADHASSDWRAAIDLLDYLSGSNEITEAYFRLIDLRAKAKVCQPMMWQRIERVAENLCRRGTLSRPEILQAII